MRRCPACSLPSPPPPSPAIGSAWSCTGLLRSSLPLQRWPPFYLAITPLLLHAAAAILTRNRPPPTHSHAPSDSQDYNIKMASERKKFESWLAAQPYDDEAAPAAAE